jgi:ferredoxin
MKVTANLDVCAGHGQCLLAAPEIFDLPDDSDHVVVLDASPDESLRSKVTRAVGMCPVSALTLTD